jgi:YggT family protein
MNPIQIAALFLIQILFDFYILILLLRLILQHQHASYFNPICQFVVKLTDPIIKPLQRIIPGFKGFDLAIILVILLVGMGEAVLILWLQFSQFPKVAGLLLFGISRLCIQVINLYFYAIIIAVILSWISSPKTGALREVVFLITEPILRPARQLIPLISGIDFSPLVVILLLQLIEILLVNPLLNLGLLWALR